MSQGQQKIQCHSQSVGLYSLAISIMNVVSRIYNFIAQYCNRLIVVRISDFTNITVAVSSFTYIIRTHIFISRTYDIN